MTRPASVRAVGLLLFLALATLGCRRSETPASAQDVTEAGSSASGRGLIVLNPLGDRPTYWDFDRIPFGSRPEHVFKVQNADPEPVTILDMLASCGCTVPRVSYTAADGTAIEGSKSRAGPVIVLPPGAVADIAIRIETSHVERMNVDKLAQVRVRSNSKTTPYLTFEMHLVVERAFQAIPPKIELFESPQSAGRSTRADVVREVAGSPCRITGIDAIEGPFTATLDATDNQGHPIWVLVVTPKNDLPLGAATGAVVLAATGSDGQGAGAPLRVPVMAQIVPDIMVRPPLLALGEVDPGPGVGASAALEALVPGERFLVLGATLHGVASDALELAWEPVDSDGQGRGTRWKLSLKPTAALSTPEFAGRVVVETDHPRLALIEVPYSGSLR